MKHIKELPSAHLQMNIASHQALYCADNNVHANTRYQWNRTSSPGCCEVRLVATCSTTAAVLWQASTQWKSGSPRPHVIWRWQYCRDAVCISDTSNTCALRWREPAGRPQHQGLSVSTADTGVAPAGVAGTVLPITASAFANVGKTLSPGRDPAKRTRPRLSIFPLRGTLIGTTRAC